MTGSELDPQLDVIVLLAMLPDDEAGLKSAYRRAARKLHPDRNPDDAQAHEKTVRLNQVREVLQVQAARNDYSRRLVASLSAAGCAGDCRGSLQASELRLALGDAEERLKEMDKQLRQSEQRADILAGTLRRERQSYAESLRQHSISRVFGHLAVAASSVICALIVFSILAFMALRRPDTDPDPRLPSLPPSSMRVVARIAWTDGLGVLLRPSPGRTELARVGLPEGTCVIVGSDAAAMGWAHVYASNGANGWIPSRYLARDGCGIPDEL